MEGLRRICCDTIVNCRDLGGYLCADGSVTQFGRLFRFGLPQTPPDSDLALFERQGIRHIFDLRSGMESKRTPNPFASHPAFAYEFIPLYEMNPTFIFKSGDLWNVYQFSIDRYKAQYNALFRALLAAKEPAAFHCHGGKDRTGMVAALILDLAGVAREDIIADYQVSETYLREFYDLQPKKRFQIINKQKYMPSDPELMERFLRYLEEQYGGANGYLQTVGLSGQEIKALGMLLKV